MLVLLTQMPRYVVTLTPLALLLLGAFLPLPFGFVALGVFFLLTLWLAYLSWPGVTPGHRALRVGMLAVVVAIVVLRIVRR